MCKHRQCARPVVLPCLLRRHWALSTAHFFIFHVFLGRFMRKKIFAAFLASLLGAGWVGTAQANCEFAYPGCGACPPGKTVKKASKIGRLGCMPCSHAYCESLECHAGADSSKLAKKKRVIENILKDLEPDTLALAENKTIALEIAEKTLMRLRLF